MSQSEVRSWRVQVFFDGDCPLCRREIKMLQRLDRKDRIRFTNIADKSFAPSVYGKSMAELMDEIHGRLPDGEWIVGVEVFRRLYSAIGLNPIVWLTRLPLVAPALDFGYQMFAKHRLRLTGRCETESCEIGKGT